MAWHTTMIVPPSIERLASFFATLVPPLPVEITGAWSSSTRLVYRDKNQLGTGMGPFVEVIDLRWQGRIDCAEQVAGIAFLVRDDEVHWAKSPPPVPGPAVEVSLHARAGEHPEGATFATSLGGSGLPAVPIPTGANLAASCLLHPGSSQTGRAHIVATAEGVAFVVVLFQRAVIKVGRNRLWRLRDELAAGLPQPVREILTRGRTGVINAQWTESCR